MKKAKKKAFTIVELVIVIAVIAILAAVLIPTFKGIIKKAQISKDTQLVRSLNMAVAMDLIDTHRSIHPTAHDAVVACVNYGFVVQDIVSTSGYDIAWYRGTGNFVLIDTESNTAIYPTQAEISNLVIDATDTETDNRCDYFLVRGSMPDQDNEVERRYSIYAGNGWTATDVELNGTGFDAGYWGCIKTITYTNTIGDQINKADGIAKDVVIRTNTFGTRLSVDGYVDPDDKSKGDVVTHYGFAGLVEIINVAKASYDEYGVIGRLSATNENATAHLEIKAGATVYQIEQLGGEATSVTVDPDATVYDINHEKVEETITDNNERFRETAAAGFIVTETHSTGERITGKACVHEYSEDVVDSQHVYEVCKTCGYTVIKIRVNTDTTAKVVTMTSGDNVIIPKAMYGYDQITNENKDVNGGDIDIDEIVGKDSENQDAKGLDVVAEVEPTPEVDSSVEPDPTCKHEWADAVSNSNGKHTIKCDKCGISYSEDCDAHIPGDECSECHYAIPLTVPSEITIGDGETLAISVGESISWTSDDEDVAVVENGVLIAKNAGTATITANGKATCDVTVTLFHNGNWNWAYADDNNPSEIANAKQWCNMVMAYYYGYGEDYYGCLYGSYKLVDDIDFEGVSLPEHSDLWYGVSIDGNGKKVKNIVSGYSLFSNKTAYSYGCNINVRNITFENCSYSKYGFAQYLYGSSKSSLKNVAFNNCTFEHGITDYVYGTILEMKDCNFSNCDCKTAIAYGTYEYSTPASIKLENVDVVNSKCNSGSYLFYCGYGTVEMVDCDSTNATIIGISQMACGGFIGNASGAKVVLTNCSIGGSLSVPSGAVAGFIGQSSANKIPVLTNCKVLQNTCLRNMGSSGSVIAFCSYLNNDSTGNIFNGYACSTDINSCTGATFVKGENWLKHTQLSIDDFVFETDGTLKYVGDGEFEKLAINQSITFSRYDSQKDEWKGGFSRFVGEFIVENVNGATTLGSLPYVTNYTQIVDENNPIELQYSTTDKSIINDNTWSNSANRVYFKDGMLAMDARLYATGGFDCFTGTNESTTVNQVTMSISIQSYDKNNLSINSVILYYTFNPSN